jgi:hypothetical protein
MATSASTMIAAMVAKARREVREHFEQRNALDIAHAVPYDPPDSMHRRQFDNLIGRGILRETGVGRYWIDREAQRLEEERRRAAALLVLKVILAAVALSVAGAAIVAAMH